MSSDDFNEDQLLHEGDDEVGAEDGAKEDNGNGEAEGGAGDDPELEAIKARVRQMEEEALKLKQMQSEVS